MAQHHNVSEINDTVVDKTYKNVEPQQEITNNVATVLSSESDESDAYNIAQSIMQLNPDGEFKF